MPGGQDFDGNCSREYVMAQTGIAEDPGLMSDASMSIESRQPLEVAEIETVLSSHGNSRQ